VRIYLVLPVAVVACCVPAVAADPDRFVERTPLPKHPPDHTPERAGLICPVARYAVPGVSRYEAGGYVGGGALFRGGGRGPCDGTFGWDYVGFGWRPGRVFLGWLNDRPGQSALARKYATDGPRVPDVIAAQPVRRAVKEAKAEKHEAHGAHDGD